jgi:hypothetical protein
MILEKQLTLRPLIESKGGIHLTVYIKNMGSLESVKAQIRESIIKTEMDLGTALSSLDLRLFLAPLRLLLNNDKLLKNIGKNLGIFRTTRNFRILSLPIEVENVSVIATSFHIKPLLKWIRLDKEFLVIGLGQKKAYLYTGTQNSIRLSDTFEVESGFIEKDKKTIHEISSWIQEKYNFKSKIKIYFAGEARLIQSLKNSIKKQENVELLPTQGFRKNQIDRIVKVVREKLYQESILEFESLVTEFYSAEARQLTGQNLFQIASAISKGRVKKLIVADDIKIFGRYCDKSGNLTIHPRDLDHEDDDILDDLAQSVLLNGGDVVVAPKEIIPDGRIAWAILTEKPTEATLKLKKRTQTTAQVEERIAV